MMISGGYQETVAIDKDAAEILDKALKGFVGAKYTPFAYATKVVKGTNYRFFCSGKLSIPHDEYFDAYVYVYVPTSGDPELQDIVRI